MNATMIETTSLAASPAYLRSDAPPSPKAVWIGRALSGLAVTFLTMDAGIKLLRLPVAMEGTMKVGFPASAVLVIGILQLICLALYLIPRTAIIGAVLWTGYLGGAVATHYRMGDPLFSHVLAPVYMATILWAGLWLRDRRVSALLASKDQF
jgi:hypothetical protein